MEWALGAALGLYLAVGVFVLFRRLRWRGGPSLSASGQFGGDLWPFLAAAAFWPLYLRDKQTPRRAEPEERCLSCHRPMPTGAAKCAECGWTWQPTKLDG
jgi:hypothetical protein